MQNMRSRNSPPKISLAQTLSLVLRKGGHPEEEEEEGEEERISYLS